jgi:putative tRNA adenosine deaminase-associated protein
VSDHDDAIDFALAAYREGGEWRVQDLSHDHLADVDTISDALRRLPGDEAGAVALVGVDEDFFVIVRVDGPLTRVLLSDVTAADDWELADSVIDFLGLPDPEDEDDEPVPVGDLDLLGDLGMHGAEMGVLLDDEDDDRYPDEVLSDVARQLGFGELFDDAVGLSPA